LVLCRFSRQKASIFDVLSIIGAIFGFFTSFVAIFAKNKRSTKALFNQDE